MVFCVMSRFSGKCDFHDEIVIAGLEHILNSEVYVGNSAEPLKLTCLADCVPYYPYVVSIAYHDNVKKCGYIKLTEKSWVDIEIERYGKFNIHDYYKQALQEEIERARQPGYSL